MKIFNIFLVIAVVAIGVYFVRKNRGKIKKMFDSLPAETQPQKEQETFTQPQQYDILAKDEFKKKYGSFSGIYEAFFEVANGTSIKAKEVIADWNMRVNYLNSCPNVQKLWFSLFKNYESFPPEQQKKSANAFLNFIYSTGIRRDNRGELMVDEKTKFQYFFNSEKIKIGDTIKIILPCWIFGDKILEKGILTLSL